MLAYLKRTVLLVYRWFRPNRYRPGTHVRMAASEAADQICAQVIVARPKPSGMTPELKKLERARRRYDVFVKPKGQQPTKKSHAARKPEPIEVVEPTQCEQPENGEWLIAEATSYGDDVLIKESEIYGEFNFRDTILDQLERYFVYLRRMQKRDPDSFGFYRQIGITLLPYAAIDLTDLQFRNEHEPNKEKQPDTPLPEWFKQNRPAFGAFAFGTNTLIEKHEKEYAEKHGRKRAHHPRFLYFTKYSKPPPTVEAMSGGDVYQMTIWWDTDDGNARHGGTPQEFAVFVSADGEKVRILKTLERKQIRVKARRSPAHTRGPYFFDIPASAWRIPRDYVAWAKKNGEDVERFLRNLFCMTVQNCERANYSMVRVNVKKRDLVAVFGVNIKRVPYFFQDRDITLTESGAKRRIFHIVRPHQRTIGTSKANVRFHFRGLREFEWAGYHVKITVPARDHFMVPEFDVGTIDSYWHDPREAVLSMPEVADRLVSHMDDGVGGRVREQEPGQRATEAKKSKVVERASANQKTTRRERAIAREKPGVMKRAAIT